MLSHWAAAYLAGLIKGTAPVPEVTTTSDRRVPGLRIVRSRSLDWRDITAFAGIRSTTVPRTLVDIAPRVDDEELVRLCHEAWIRYRVTPSRVDAVLGRKPKAPGAQRLRRVMGGDVRVLLGELEKGFLCRLRAETLPLPETNKVASGRRVDCRWPEHGLTVELNSYQFHNSRYSWEQDYRREREAYRRRDAFRRYTWHDVFEDPREMLAELHEFLVRRARVRR